MFWFLWSCVSPTPQIDTPASQSVQTKETQEEKAAPLIAKAIPESSTEKPETTFRVKGALERPLGKTFQAASMGKSVPSMYSGDRLWITAETPIQLHLYAVSVYQQSRYRLIWTSSPGRQDREVTLFPQGLTIDQAYLEMDTFLLIGSNEPIQWLTDKLDIRCDDWRGKMPPKTPTNISFCMVCIGLSLAGSVVRPLPKRDVYADYNGGLSPRRRGWKWCRKYHYRC